MPKGGTKVRTFLNILLLTFAVALLAATAAVSATDSGLAPGTERAHIVAPSRAILSGVLEPNLLVDFPHKSLVFTVADVVFFSYSDGTMLELYDSSDNLVWNNGGVALDKGGHALVTVSEGVYLAQGSEKFAVLTGDPISLYVMGYYAMDQDGYGASTEIYTWVPQLYDHCKFVIFAYHDDTDVTVEYTDTGVDIVNVNLDKGEHWDTESLDTEWLHVTSDKPVSALTCYDQGYFVPSATGNWSGTEFYTYVSDISGWPQDLTVIAFYDNTTVTVSETGGALIWSGTLNNGQAHVEGYPSGADKFFTITSDQPVTVSVQPWVSSTSSYHQGAYIQDRNGVGIGTDLIGSTLSNGYLYILSYYDGTVVDVYNSQTNAYVTTHNLDEGDFVQGNPGNGLWRLRSNNYISAYSGYGIANGDFAPVQFGAIINPLNLNKTDGLGEEECINPGQDATYTICYDNTGNDFDVENVTLTDYLATEMNFVSASDGGVYDGGDHKVVWDIGTLLAGAPEECVELVVQMDISTTPDITLTNSCTIESDQTPPTTVTEDTKICPVIPIFVDIKPTSCPNSFNPKQRGVLPAAILGTEDFDVTMIDPASIVLTREGDECEVSPLRWDYEDVATPFEGELCDCHGLGGDGFMDLTIKFSSPEVVECLDIVDFVGETIPLIVEGNLLEEFSGTNLLGSDCIRVLRTGKKEDTTRRLDLTPDGGRTVSFETITTGRVRIDIFDVRGRIVATLVDRTLESGSHSATWDGKDLSGQEVPAGVYFVRLSDREGTLSRKMVYVK
jgi:uncharacterized repeat protein (TIGR01451 family)